MKIGDKLKQGRMTKNLTQVEVGEILNVSRRTVSSWELNRKYQDLELLVALSDLYDISLDTILREDEKMIQSLSEEIRTGRKRNYWLTLFSMIYFLILIFYVFLLIQGNQIISMQTLELYSLKRTGLISVLMLSSLALGVISWVLPIVQIFSERIKTQPTFLIISISSCAIAISFQVIYHNLMLQTNDFSGLMDTSGTLTVVTIILLLGTLGLNFLSNFIAFKKEQTL